MVSKGRRMPSGVRKMMKKSASNLNLSDYLFGTSRDPVQLELFPSSNVFGLGVSADSDEMYRCISKANPIALLELKVGLTGTVECDSDGDYHIKMTDSDGDIISEYDIFDRVTEITPQEIFELSRTYPENTFEEAMQMHFLAGKMTFS